MFSELNIGLGTIILLFDKKSHFIAYLIEAACSIMAIYTLNLYQPVYRYSI